MTWIYKTLRTIIVTVLVLAIFVPALLYVFLSVPSVQNRLCSIGSQELTKLLGAEVSIGSANIMPFNKVALNDVSVVMTPGDTALRIDRIGAGVMMWKLVTEQKLVFSYAEIIGLDAHLHRDSAGSPLNIQPIIDHLQKTDPESKPAPYDLRINNIVIRRGAITYDINDRQPIERGMFDRAHICISDLKADILIPRISNELYIVDLKRLALREQSGVRIESLALKGVVSDSSLTIDKFDLSLPESRLSLAPVSVTYDGWNDLKQHFADLPWHVATMPECHVATADIAPFYRALGSIDDSFNIDFDIIGPVDSVTIKNLSVESHDHRTSASVKGHVTGLPDIASLAGNINHIDLRARGENLTRFLNTITTIPAKTQGIISRAGIIEVSGSASGSMRHAEATMNISTDAGIINIDADYNMPTPQSATEIKADVSTEDFRAGYLIDNTKLGNIGINLTSEIKLRKGTLTDATAEGSVTHIDWQGYRYNDVALYLDMENTVINGTATIDDANARVLASGQADLDRSMKSCDVRVEMSHLDPFALRLTPKYEGFALSGTIEAALHGPDIDHVDGRLQVSNLKFISGDSTGIDLPMLAIESSGTSMPQYVTLRSDIIDGKIEGSYRWADIVPATKAIATSIMPMAFPESTTSRQAQRQPIDIKAHLELKESDATNRMLAFVKSPVKVLHPITIDSRIDELSQTATLDLEAPYLLQKDKFIDNTALHFAASGQSREAMLKATTLYPTKQGNATINLNTRADSNSVATNVAWTIDRQREFKGVIDLLTTLTTDENRNLGARVNINHSELVFNDTVWTVHPAVVTYSPKRIEIDGFDVSRDKQYIRINGVVSENPVEQLRLQLLDVNLDYVFETLGIDKAMFGGDATGTFYASNLFSKEPRLSTPGLHVDGLCYNHSLLGDADIVSAWDNATRGITINATVKQPNGRSSVIDGAIFPLNDSLDFRFKADRINVGFMKPYMEAFTSDVSGYASGDARLYGTFKYIDMTGNIFAEDLRLKLDFTNTYYTTTDSIFLTPGHIDFHDVTLYDTQGHPAMLSGWVTHEFFKQPRFEFNVSQARDLLVFDVNDRMSPDWYGRIYCNGGAHIKGVPGFIDINVNMSTAPGSVFTFVLSDTEMASEYTFLTFRDRDVLEGRVVEKYEDPKIAAVNRLKEHYAKLRQEEEGSSVYRLNLQIEATPTAEMILVMDPAGGDRIRAHGSGNLRIDYNSSDDEMKMFGTYSLTRGSYNFTLQDIIIKDFTINPGSSISFHGDPLAATLDIEAAYSVNANLSDLDESFLQDKELNRTNVPVHALMKVTGDMQQPDIAFDLEFPTLTQDTYRKVRSIVSTEDMMNRQIIYLLALNRFYTPDYMGSTTKGNELVSVASSTISSQLSSILGQLSDNWSIAPNFRSDKGDFSDMEVDLALSSQLLNNRLLFNGNFGYRDNALNNNSFIGDFDIEYLLNKSGNLRLKAYNRYNDQNYYVKSALTTQGVGILWRRDFDNIFSFLRSKKKKKK